MSSQYTGKYTCRACGYPAQDQADLDEHAILMARADDKEQHG